MKKIFSLMMVFLFGITLVSCEKEDVNLKIMTPLGSPALAQTYMESTLPSLGEHVTYEIDVVIGTDPLVAAFGSGTHDIIYAPTNLGAKLISTGIEYKFAATVVWGNLYLVTTGLETFTLDDLDGKEIVVFGKNATPDIILQSVIDNHTYTIPPTYRYVDSANTAQGELLQDPSIIILIAEPLLSVLALPSKIGDMNIIDLQSEWEDLTGNTSYPQAGIFVKSSLDEDLVNDYLAQVEISVNETTTNAAGVAQMAVDLEYGLPVSVLTGAIPRSNLMYKDALESKEALELYFNYILEFNGALIGGVLPGDDFYFGG